MKRIVSVSLPHWQIERLGIEMARRPQSFAGGVRGQLRGAGDPAGAEPFGLVETVRGGVRLAAINGAARAAGLRAGDALSDARAMLPALGVQEARPAADKEGLRRLARWIGRYGILRNAYGVSVESSSGHRLRAYGLWVDITGVAHLYGGEAGLMADLSARLERFGLTAQAALADTLGAAHALAWYGGSHTIAPPGGSRAALSALPVAALRIDRATAHLLHRLGFKTIGSLAAVPRVALERRFHSRDMGRRVLMRLDQALGVMAEPRRPLVEPPVLAVSQPFAEPLISAEGLDHAIAELTEAFCGRLEAAGVGARAVRLVLYRCDGTVGEGAVVLAQAARSPGHILHLLREKLALIDLGFGVDLLSMEAALVERFDAGQGGLAVQSAHDLAERSARLIDRLVNRLGPERVLRIVRRESHWPERSFQHVSVRGDGRGGGGVGRSSAADVSTIAGRPLPALLLSPPEPITVLAGIPEGAPVRFTWRRVMHRIVRAEGPQRIEPEWWRQIGAPGSSPVRARDYYALEDEEGAQFWVFRAGRYDRCGAGDGEGDGAGDGEGAGLQPAWFVHGQFA